MIAKILGRLPRRFGDFCQLAGTLIFIGAFAGLALANQSNTWSPTTGTVSGLQLTTNYNNAFAAIQTANSGATAPTNDISGLPVKGQLWLDTSVTPNILKQYDGTSWIILGSMDTAGHRWLPPIGGGTDTLASATTTDLGSKASGYITITGTTGITGFGSSAVTGTFKAVTFSGAVVLTKSSPGLILPTNASTITTAAGDALLAVATGSGNWTVIDYTRADGTALNASSVFTGAVNFNGAISPANLTSNTNDWNPTNLATANTIRFSCNAAIQISGITAPATDGKILLLDNVGATNACTITAQDTNSTAANRFAFNQPIAVPPLSQLSVRYDLTTARWKLVDSLSVMPLSGGFRNLRVYNSATAMGDAAPATPATMMTIKADAITVEDVNGNARRLLSVTCTIDYSQNSSFTAGSGGLDTSTLAAPNWYASYVIYNPTTNVVSCLASLQSTYAAATQPSGYTFGARVGWNRYVLDNALTQLRRVVQYGRVAKYAVTAATNTIAYPTIGTSTGGAFATLSITPFVPTTAYAIAVFGGAATNSAQGAISSTSATSPSSFVTNPSSLGDYSATGSFLAVTGNIVLEGTNIFAAVGAGTMTVFAVGWEDNL